MCECTFTGSCTAMADGCPVDIRSRHISQAGMDLRVLHAIAHGQTWYGARGYAFGRGTFHIPLKQWQAAVHKMHKAKVAALWPQFDGSTAEQGPPLAAVLHRYVGEQVHRDSCTSLSFFRL